MDRSRPSRFTARRSWAAGKVEASIAALGVAAAALMVLCVLTPTVGGVAAWIGGDHRIEGTVRVDLASLWLHPAGLILPAAVVLHEGGHAAAARAFGGRFVTFVVHGLGVGTMVDLDGVSWARRALVSLTGPVVGIVFALTAAAAAAVVAHGSPRVPSGILLGAWAVLGWAVLAVVQDLTNLIPFKLGGAASDGWNLIDRLRRHRAQVTRSDLGGEQP